MKRVDERDVQISKPISGTQTRGSPMTERGCRICSLHWPPWKFPPGRSAKYASPRCSKRARYIARSLATLPIYAVEYNVRFYWYNLPGFRYSAKRSGGIYARPVIIDMRTTYAKWLRASKKGDERVFDTMKKKDDSLVRRLKKIRFLKNPSGGTETGNTVFPIYEIRIINISTIIDAAAILFWHELM